MKRCHKQINNNFKIHQFHDCNGLISFLIHDELTSKLLPPPPIPHTDSKLLQWMTTFSLAASLTRRKHDFKCSQNFLLGRTSAGGGTLCDSLNASLPMNSFSWEVSPSPRPHSHLSTIVSEQTNYSELCKEKLIKCRLITGNLI